MRCKKKSPLRLALAKWQLYLLILPAIIYVFIFSYIPMYGVLIAFKNYNPGLGIWGSPWVGLEHFVRFLEYPKFWSIFSNTLLLSLYSLAPFPITIIFALLLNELTNIRFKKAVQMISYMPHFFSTVVMCSIILLFTDRSTGVINNLISLLGFERVDFISSTAWFPSIYVWSGVWQDLGWCSIIYISALSGVSPELIEAAHIDGASKLQIMWHINIPAIIPTIITIQILNCGSILSVGFEKIYLLQNPLNLSVSQVISTYTYEIGLLGAQFSYSSAIGLFNTVINVAVLCVVNAIAKRVSEVSIW